MLFSWQDDTIRWYEAASDYTDYYKHLAAALEPMVRGVRNFADLGCGLGHIDLELSPILENICCVDISERATGWLREMAAKRGAGNIEVICGDCFELEREFDLIYLCFFSSRKVELFLPHCKKLISIVGGPDNAPLFPQQFRRKKKNTIDGERRHLDALGLGYKLTELRFEFGQPLESIPDACAYVRTYAPDIPQDELDRFLEERLVKTGDPRYPLYMPRDKTVGVFEIEGWLK